jgi:hypothetical protein
MSKLLTGDGTWHLFPEIIGDDICVHDQIATWFGGDSDPMDDGETASGIRTKGRPLLIGCSLPMDFGKRVKNTQGSPIPIIEWLTLVEVTNLDAPDMPKLLCPLIDIGPAKKTLHALDLTQEAFKRLGGNLNRGTLRVDFRIIGGARFAV